MTTEDLQTRLMAALAAALGRLRAAGLDADEAAYLIERRLAGPGLAVEELRPPAALDQVLVDAPAGPAHPGSGRVPAATPPEREEIVPDPAPVPPPNDLPPEPPVGTVGTDTRGRVCKREPEGWYRPGTGGPLSWAQVYNALLGPDGEPLTDAAGAPKLQPARTTIEISEIVPADRG